MASQALPISNLVNVQIGLAPAALQAQNLSTMLLLGSSPVIDLKTRMRSYPSITAVAVDFSDSDPEFLDAEDWFAQSPQPTNLLIGRFAPAGGAGQLIGAPLTAAQQTLANFTAITAGGFKILINGNSAVEVDTINLSGAGNLNAVASIINTKLQALTPPASIIWNASFARFEVTSSTEGAASTIGFLIAPTTGVDISALLGLAAVSNGSYLSTGVAAETPLAAVVLFDNLFGQQFFGLEFAATIADADAVAVAAFIEANSVNAHYFWDTTQDNNTLNQSTNQATRAGLLAAAKYNFTASQFSSTDPHAATSLAARMLTVSYTGNNTVINAMYKNEPGVVPEQINQTQAQALSQVNCNVFVPYNNGSAIIQFGTAASGLFLDIPLLIVNLKIDIQTALFALLYDTDTKIPQDDSGQHQLTTAVEAVLSQYVRNGSIAPGTWNGPDIGGLSSGDFLSKGFYVYSAPLALQAETDRQKRIAMPIQFAVKLAGAIQTVLVTGTIDE